MKLENQNNIFEKFVQGYDKMIAWETRLTNEEPFFHQLVSGNNLRSVLDVGCGTGRHATIFAGMGLQVLGVDPSPAMIAEAVKIAAEKQVEVDFAEYALGQLKQIGQTFDLVTCLGNTLAHIRSQEALEAALKDIYDVIEKDGSLVIQMRNYDKVFLKEERFMPLNSFSEENEEYLFLRMTDLVSDTEVQFNVLVFYKSREGKWSFEVFSELLAPWRRGLLVDMLERAGFGPVKTYGNYQKGPWLEAESNDLIIVAEKCGLCGV